MKDLYELKQAVNKAERGEFVLSVFGSVFFVILWTALIIYKLRSQRQQTSKIIWLQIFLLLCDPIIDLIWDTAILAYRLDPFRGEETHELPVEYGLIIVVSIL